MKQEQNLNTNPQTRACRLYVMCGPAGSGKSTWAKEHLVGEYTTYISRDEVRMSMITDKDHYFSKEREVFKEFINRIQYAVNKCGNDVVVDATHLDKFSRRKLTNALDDALVEPWEIIYVVMDTSYEECCRRNDNRSGRANVPHDVIWEMYEKMTCPRVGEHLNVKGVWLIKEREGIGVD